MQRILTLSLGALLGLSVAGHATTVTFGASPASRSVVDASGAAVSTSALVWIGVFSSPAAFTYNPALSISQNVSNIESAGGWQQFLLNPSTQQVEGTSTLALNTVAGNSKVAFSVTDNVTGSATASADFFNGKQIYLWIFNASTVAGSSQMGIYTATGASPAWTFPSNAGGVGDTVSLSTTSTAAPTVSAIGGTGSASTTQLVLAPELTSIVTLVGGAGLLAMMRRRKAAR